MKKQGKIITLLSLFALSLVTSGILLNAQSNNEHAVAETESVTVYLKPNANWLADNARFAVYWFDSSNSSVNGWTDMEQLESDSEYYVATIDTADTSTYALVFCRMNPSTTDNSWSNKWNQTGDMFLRDTSSYICVINDDAWDNSSYWDTKHQSQSDETYDVYLRVVPLLSTQSGISFDFSSNGEGGVTPNIHFWSSTSSDIVGATKWPGIQMDKVDEYDNLYKATLSTSFDSVIFNSVSSSGRTNKTYNLNTYSIVKAYDSDRIVGYSVGGDAISQSGNEFVYSGSWATISQPVVTSDIYTLWLNRNNNWADDYTYIYISFLE